MAMVEMGTSLIFSLVAAYFCRTRQLRRRSCRRLGHLLQFERGRGWG